jgi:hypothetical protein
MLMMGWGYRIERLQASMYMVLYTLLASLPFLLVLFVLSDELRRLNYLYLAYGYKLKLNNL